MGPDIYDKKTRLNVYEMQWLEKRSSSLSFLERENLVSIYAWAIPNYEAISTIVKHSPVIEIGAGSGYWASLVKILGGDVIAFDNRSPNFKFKCEFFPVEKGDERAVVDHSDRALMLCWPPYSTPMAYKCLKKYKGQTLIYIGEGEGGCTADIKLFELLGREWEEEEYVKIPQWWGLHDGMTIYKRK
jgi:hypothetical protein